uniref:TNFR-Cys domain-containing protein n=1 Tax=Denticeps clupeoides TaxID=299321 RepID=A0AAY4D895_9TELE
MGLVSGGCPAGQYRDGLLRRCMPCQVVCQHPHGHAGRCVCGHHPSECASMCEGKTVSCECILRPDGAAVRTMDSRGSPGGAVLYSLLGLCVMLLICSLSMALLVLLRKGKGQRTQQEPSMDQQPNKHGRSSRGLDIGPILHCMI